jgi:hypothetical protein
MSTRGTLGIRYDGQDKLVYNHSDSYPEGLGDAIYQDIKAEIEKNRIPLDSLIGLWRQQALAARLIAKVRHSMPTEADKHRCRVLNLVNLQVSEQSEDDWYCLLRNAQGKLLTLLNVGLFLDAGGFILNSLHCEWGYILNLDSEELEVYKGFQSQPHQKGRYAAITTVVEEYQKRNAELKTKYPDRAGYSDDDRHHLRMVYYPCALIASIPIREIPNHACLTDYLETTGLLNQEGE